MASSVSAPVVVRQATKRPHAEVSSSEMPSEQNQQGQSSVKAEVANSTSGPGAKNVDSKVVMESRPTGSGVSELPCADSKVVNSVSSHDLLKKDNTLTLSSENSVENIPKDASSLSDGVDNLVEAKASSSGASSENSTALPLSDSKEVKKTSESASNVPNSNALSLSSQLTSELSVADACKPAESAVEPVEASATGSQNTAMKPNLEDANASSSKTLTDAKSSNSKTELEYGEEPEKKAKVAASTSKNGGRTPEQVLDHMDKTFEQRRKIITKQMPSIPELQELYPDLFTGKQLLLEFQRITKIDIDQKIQEFCVRYATAVIEMARNKKGSAPVLARWEQAKQENDTLRQYWDMVTALCLLPLHFDENFVEMVLEIEEDEEVVPQGKIVPTLVARGNIFRTDEFFLIAENTIVQEFEEFTIAFASLYSSYWVFNMEYPETIANTYNYIQRCIVRQREPGSVPAACKNFTKALLKWNKGKDGK
ncbi:unnamed protein product [Candidula unifasciata]|uniref:Uncharacterized protein n=1 Tax=Candidula unifasciata TaxID=100452 RepID=A0A8S3YXL5_9EUPU|nr:unnamed protein product [Candidula unifasciata]